MLLRAQARHVGATSVSNGRALRATNRPHSRRCFAVHSRLVAASALVRGEVEPAAAVAGVADQLLRDLGRREPQWVLFFAKGYGGRAQLIGPQLRERLSGGAGGSGSVVVGAASEGGVITGNAAEVQEERFALAAFALCSERFRAYPFYSRSAEVLPRLGRGASWSSLMQPFSQPLSVLAFCSLPMTERGDAQGLLDLLDRELAMPDAEHTGQGLATVVGGLPVGGQVFVDGELHSGGGVFGLALQPTDAEAGGGSPPATLDPVVCQGAAPFGPWLEVTGVGSDHVITSLDGGSPAEVLMPLMHSSEVPGEGHTMAGVFVDPTPITSLPTSAVAAQVAASALRGRPNCIIRPMHQFTPEGYLVLSPLTKALPYECGMKLQLHCHSPELALQELRARTEHDMALNDGRPPDAAVIIQCGARGISLHGEEGVESRLLREVWGADVPTIGFFAGGEFGPVGLKTYLHTYTTSCLMLRG